MFGGGTGDTSSQALKEGGVNRGLEGQHNQRSGVGGLVGPVNPRVGLGQPQHHQEKFPTSVHVFTR